jgi:ribosome-binding protein aMBF1 (putative translation factor)
MTTTTMTPAQLLAEKLASQKKTRGKAKYTPRWKSTIREKRTAIGLHPCDVSEALGMKQSDLHMIEAGKWMPRMDVIRKLEDFFGCSHRELWEPLAEDTTTPPTTPN